MRFLYFYKGKSKNLLFLFVLSILLISASYRNSASIPHFPNWDWSLTETVSSESDDSSIEPSITTDKLNNVHVVWVDETEIGGSGTDRDIYYKFWNGNTEDWSAIELVSDVSNQISQFPQIATDSQNNVHIVWVDRTDYLNSSTDEDVFYKSKNFSTGIWSITSVISDTSTGSGAVVAMSIDSKDNIHIVWDDNTPYSGSGVDTDIIYRRYDKINASWGSPWVVSWTSTADSIMPTLTTDTQDNVYFVWTDVTDYLSSGTDRDLFYRFYNVSSNLWSSIDVATLDVVGEAASASIAVDSINNIHITWSNSYYNGFSFEDDIIYRFWNTTSSSWSNQRLIGPINAIQADIAIDSQDNPHIVWSEKNVEGDVFDNDIFYRYKNITANPLVPWSEQETVSTLSTSRAKTPEIIVDDNDNFHVVYSDATDNLLESGIDLDIFYKVRANLQNFDQSNTIYETVTDISTTRESAGNTITETSTLTLPGNIITKTIGETEETVFTSTIFETNQKSEVSLPIFFVAFSLLVLGLISRKKE